MSIDAAWLPEQSDTVGAAETEWARAFLDALQPHRAGVYVNFLDSDDDMSRVREAYGDDTYRRLAEVKAEIRPRQRVPQQQEHPAPCSGAVISQRIESCRSPETHRPTTPAERRLRESPTRSPVSAGGLAMTIPRRTRGNRRRNEMPFCIRRAPETVRFGRNVRCEVPSGPGWCRSSRSRSLLLVRHWSVDETGRSGRVRRDGSAGVATVHLHDLELLVELDVIRRSSATSTAVLRSNGMTLPRCCRRGSTTTTDTTDTVLGRGREVVRGVRGWLHLRPGEGAGPLEPSSATGCDARRGVAVRERGLQGLIDKAFAELGAERVYASTMTVNTASRRVMERRGCATCGRSTSTGPSRSPATSTAVSSTPSIGCRWSRRTAAS